MPGDVSFSLSPSALIPLKSKVAFEIFFASPGSFFRSCAPPVYVLSLRVHYVRTSADIWHGDVLCVYAAAPQITAHITESLSMDLQAFLWMRSPQLHLGSLSRIFQQALGPAFQMLPSLC